MSETEAQTQQKIISWIEGNIGGKVVSIARQPRWRPNWFADVERGSDKLELCVRGDRVDTKLVFPLDHEMRIQKVMWDNGIPVPKVYGWCDDPRAFVMERVPGVPHFDGVSEAVRDSVMREYMECLARLHALDVKPFADAGIVRAPRPSESATVGQAQFIKIFREIKKRPDPFIEFMLAWLARNPLQHAGRESVIVWDSGQFHHHKGRFISLIDVEIGHIGDPMMDLAGFRMRDSVLHFGDMDTLYRHYGKYSRDPVDMDAIKHHHLFFTLSNQLSFHGALAAPTPDSDYMTNLQWCTETNRFAVEALADIMGITLPEVEIPQAEVSPVAPQFDHMITSLKNISVPDEYTRYKLRGMFRLARHQQRWIEIGAEITAADLDDIGALTGKRPASWAEGEAQLEAFVLSDGGKHDEALLYLFNRRTQRAQALNGPAGSAMAAHHPLQPFKA